MIVIGGTYRERSLHPNIDQLAGSGLRAALTVLRQDPSSTLVTAVAEAEHEAVEASVNGYGLSTRLLRRSQPIEFRYFTPLDTPAIVGRESSLVDNHPVEGPSVLRFGMVEGVVPVTADVVVVDPQQPVGLTGDPFVEVTADRRGLVLNLTEATQLLAHATGPADAARELLTTFDCDAVVVKNGPRGAAIAERGTTETAIVRPHWSDRVAPLGTGDVFSAAFTYGWASGKPATEAAEWASSCVAQYAAGEDVAPPPQLPAATEPVPVNEAKVYLAGPFFTLGECWLVELCRNALAPHVFSPLHDVGRGVNVAKADIDGLEQCDSVLALVDGDDPGTLFEVGWARARDIPVVAYALSLIHIS